LGCGRACVSLSAPVLARSNNRGRRDSRRGRRSRGALLVGCCTCTSARRLMAVGLAARLGGGGAGKAPAEDVVAGERGTAAVVAHGMLGCVDAGSAACAVCAAARANPDLGAQAPHAGARAAPPSSRSCPSTERSRPRPSSPTTRLVRASVYGGPPSALPSWPPHGGDG
jgi:hypothetical protein